MMQRARTSSRILLVDNDRRLCRFLSGFLGREGYATATVHDGRAMRRAVADAGFDLVILDLTFPQGDDGISLARGLRAQHGVPLLILSGKTSTIDKVVCLELGDDDYVTKPFEPRELLAALATRPGRVLSREQILDIVANWHWSPFDRSIDVLIGKLRRKLHDHARDLQLIKTIRGVGYVLAP